MSGSGDDWVAILDRLLVGDRLAFLQINRLVSRCLAPLRAYDLREEWDDLRQEVVRAVIAHAHAGRLREPEALVGYVRIITRTKVVQRLRAGTLPQERGGAIWGNGAARDAGSAATADEIREVWSAVRDLPIEQQQVLDGVYRQGRTYGEVSATTGIPIGTMKRRIRDALAALRRRFLHDAEAS